MWSVPWALTPAATSGLGSNKHPNHKPNNGALPDTAYFQGILDQLNGLVARNQLGLFSNGYWGHPAYQTECRTEPAAGFALSGSVGLGARRRPYPCGIRWQRILTPISSSAGMQYPFSSPDFSNKDPLTGNPHWQDIVEGSINKMRYFVDNVYLPDVVLAATVYKDWANYGATGGNFLCFGDFPDPELVQQEFSDGAIDHPEGYVIPQGVIWKNKIGELKPFDETLVTENVTHAWYDYKSGVNLRPYFGETELNYTGPAPISPATCSMRTASTRG